MSSPEASPVTNTTASSPLTPVVVTNETSPPSPTPFVTYDTSPTLPPVGSPVTNFTASPSPTPAVATNERSPPSPFATYDTSSLPTGTLIGLVIGTVLGGLLMLIFVGICAFYYKKRQWRRMRRTRLDNYSGAPSQPPEAEQYGPPQHGQPNITTSSDGNVPTPAGRSLGSERPHSPPSPGIALRLSQSTFSYDELAIATNGFSRSNFLGQGGFGYVHKGVLRNGKTVAIKRLKSGSGQGEPEFQAEVDIIGRVHHRHLVSLVGCCIETQRMLVFEPTMDWPTRMKIAIGSAKGLAYLHEDCQPKIIHRDIKASNILLDDSFEAKLADFGLAKFFPDTDTHISTLVRGTFGYVAPEYAASGKLTDKSDVFSFGVVLLELITGRKPVYKTRSSTDSSSMVEWARPLLSQAWENGNFDPFVEPRLQNNYILEEMTRMVACAVTCVRRSARRRPRMGQVIRALEGNIALEDLKEGTTPGLSRVSNFFEDSGYDTGQSNEDLEEFRTLALEGQEHSTTSEYWTPNSEFGQRPSTSSSGGQQDTQEIEMKNLNSNRSVYFLSFVAKL